LSGSGSGPAPKAVQNDLLDMLDSTPPAAAASNQNSFASFNPQNSFPTADVNSSTNFTPNFNSQFSFDPFSNPPQQQSQMAFSQPSQITDPFSQPTPTLAPTPLLNVPFLKINPPAPPQSKQEAPPPADPTPSLKGFSAFDDLVDSSSLAPPAQQPSNLVNPFDSQLPNNLAPNFQPQHPNSNVPFQQNHGYYQNQQNFQHPGQHPGMPNPNMNPNMQNFNPSAVPNYAGYHQPNYQVPPQQFGNSSGFPPSNIQMMPNGGMPQMGMQNHPFYGNPQGPPQMYQQQVPNQMGPNPTPPAPAPAPVPTPAAPDPFSSMTGSAWGSVGGKPTPPVIPKFGSDVFLVDSDIPPEKQPQPQSQYQSQPQTINNSAVNIANPFDNVMQSSVSGPPVNPFDLF